MPYPAFDLDRDYLLNKYRHPVFDLSTGLDNDHVMEELDRMADELDTLPRPVAKARGFEFVCRHMAIDVSEHDCYPMFSCWNRFQRPLSKTIARWKAQAYAKAFPKTAPELKTIPEEIDERNAAGIHTVWLDFDHSVPDWEAIFTLGFPGLRDRARQYREMHRANGTLTPETDAYFEGLDITICAVIDCIGRFIDYARLKHPDNPRIQREVACLEQLRTGAPRNTYEVLQIILLHFMFCEHIDAMQVRSLGNLDAELEPYFEKDIREGRYSEEELREFLACFLMQWGSIDNYWGQPVYFGGTNPDGTTKYSKWTHFILDVYDKLDITTPKLQFKVDDNTPQDILDHTLDMIRRGHSSIVFVGEPGIRRAMMGAGCTAEEARECDIKGCYEFSPKACSNQTGAGHINLLKPIELVFNDGRDPKTGLQIHCNAAKLADIHSFGEFYHAYLAYLTEAVQTIIRVSNATEALLQDINPASLFSITILNSLKTARDAFSSGCVYNDSGILICGLGTAVDALMAVKRLVFDRKTVSLEDFRDILNNDWAGCETLRLKALRLKEKFGNAILEVDEFAAGLGHFTASLINGVPNSRGGFLAASGHCAKQYFEQGKRTGATPDGRHAGDEFSKNLSPTMGMDINGCTALIQSVTKLDSIDYPGDFPLDIMMHPATVAGQEGLAAMRALIAAYIHHYGIAIHFNIFDASVLEDAQAHPEKYEGLQIRVCGWNTRFTTMIKKEQDAYIARARTIIE